MSTVDDPVGLPTAADVDEAARQGRHFIRNLDFVILGSEGTDDSYISCRSEQIAGCEAAPPAVRPFWAAAVPVGSPGFWG